MPTVKVTRTVSTTETKEIEVSFPAFRKEIKSDRPDLVRIDEKEICTVITSFIEGFNIRSYKDDLSRYYNDRYEEITEVEFENKLREVTEKICNLSNHFHYGSPINVLEHGKEMEEKV